MPKKQSLTQSLHRIGRLIHSTLDFGEIMQRAMAEAAGAVGSETAVMSLRQGDQWMVRCAGGFPSDANGAQMDDWQEPHAVLAIDTKEPVAVNDALADERVNRAHMQKWGVRSVLVVPLVTEEQILGVLFFNQHRAGVPFRDSHVEFAEQLASSLSLVIRNACLSESLQTELAERRKAEQALQQANEQLQAQTEELQTQTEELRSQAEELATANEELRVNEQALQRLNAELEQRVAARTAELSQANAALRQAGAYHRSLLEASLDPLVTIGPDGRITDVNAATEAVTGYPRNQLLGTDFSNYFTEPRHARAGYQRVFDEGLVRDYPLEIRHRDGRTTPVLYSVWLASFRAASARLRSVMSMPISMIRGEPSVSVKGKS